ncbi:hypothetical protein Taro_056838, partial [Colocasia esculenta]|nr:hypothetical protein [Colocasia esculenta]
MSEGASLGGGRARVTDLERRGKWWGQLLLSFVELPWLGLVSEVVVALFRCGPASPSHSISQRWFRSHVGRSGVGPQLGRAAVVCGCVLGCGSLASLYRGGCRQESAAGELEEWTVCPPLSCLWWWLVCSCVTVFLTLFPRMVSHSPSLHGGCSLAVSSSVGLGCSACGTSTWWRYEVVVPVVGRCFSRGCSVSLVVTPGCSFLTSWSFFRMCFDSAGFAGVMFGLTQSSFASALLEFLLLWLVKDCEVLPEFFSVSSGGELLAVVLVRVALRTITGMFSQNGALVVLVEVLLEPVVLLPLASVFSLLAMRFDRLVGLCSGDGFSNGSWRFGWRFSRLHRWDFVCPQDQELCLEALVAIWCVALSACGGRSSASCCALLRANMVVVLLKLLVLR